MGGAADNARESQVGAALSKRFERTGERDKTYELKVSKNGNFYRHSY